MKLDGMKDGTSKRYLSKAFNEGMNYERLEAIDPEGEVKGWFDRITETIKTQ